MTRRSKTPSRISATGTERDGRVRSKIPPPDHVNGQIRRDALEGGAATDRVSHAYHDRAARRVREAADCVGEHAE